MLTTVVLSLSIAMRHLDGYTRIKVGGLNIDTLRFPYDSVLTADDKNDLLPL